jgi:hypothetical protein
MEEQIKAWKYWKLRETEANLKRLEVERELLTMQELKKGTNYIGDLKVIKTESRKWDNGLLQEMKEAWGNTVFPFKIKYEEDSKAMNVLAEIAPDRKRELERHALTITDAKPSFSYTPKGE